jgi:hypothetical protein
LPIRLTAGNLVRLSGYRIKRLEVAFFSSNLRKFDQVQILHKFDSINHIPGNPSISFGSNLQGILDSCFFIKPPHELPLMDRHGLPINAGQSRFVDRPAGSPV